MTNNKFKLDNRLAEQIGRFIDENFLIHQKNWKRIPFDTEENRALQKKGVDLIWHGHNIDEKAKVNGFLNKSVTKNSVEIFQYNKDGWFISNSSITNNYAFECVSCDNTIATEEDLGKEGASNHITAVNYVLISRNRLKEMVESQTQATMVQIIEKARQFMEQSDKNYLDCFVNPDFYLTAKRKWNSLPINLTVPMHYIIRQSKVVHIEKGSFRIMEGDEVEKLAVETEKIFREEQGNYRKFCK